MRTITKREIFARICGTSLLLVLFSMRAQSQEMHTDALPGAPTIQTSSDATALSALIRELQGQVGALNAQLADLRSEQQLAREETRELRRELDLVKAQELPSSVSENRLVAASVRTSSASAPGAPAEVASVAQGVPQAETTAERLSRLEENQEVLEERLTISTRPRSKADPNTVCVFPESFCSIFTTIGGRLTIRTSLKWRFRPRAIHCMSLRARLEARCASLSFTCKPLARLWAAPRPARI